MAAKPLQLVISAVDKATGPLKHFNDSLKRLTAPIDKAKAAFGNLVNEAGVPKLGAALKGVGSEVVGLGKTILGVLAAGGIAGGAIASLVKSSVAAGDTLAKTAGRVGLNVDAFAQFRYAAQRSGLSAEEFAGGMETLAKGLGEAKARTGSLYEAAGKLGGPVFQEQIRNAKSVEGVMYLLAKATAKLSKDQNKQIALASKLTGNAKFVNFFKEGVGGISDMRAEFIRLAGGQQAFATGSEAMADVMLNAETALTGLKTAAITTLYPALQKVGTAVTDFFVARRPAITAWAKEFAEKLPARIDSFISAVTRVGNLASGFVAKIGGWRTAFALLAAIISTKVILAIIALGAALLSTPIGLIVTGIALSAALIIRYWTPIKGFFVGLWARVREPFLSALNWIKGVFLAYTPLGLIVANWESVKAFFVGYWAAIRTIFETWFGWAKALLSWHPYALIYAHWTPIKEFFVGLWVLIREPFAAFLAWVKGVFFAWHPLGVIIANWLPLKAFFRGLWDDVVAIFESAWLRVKPIVDKVLAAAKFITSKLPSLPSLPGAGFIERVRSLGRAELAGGGASGVEASRPVLSTDAARPAPPAASQQSAKVTVKFEDAPKGLRVTSDPGSDADLDMSVGYSMASGL